MIVPVLTAAAQDPLPSSWFEYTVHEVVTGSAGAYEGYRDATEATGRYELAPGAGGILVNARYDWSFSSSEGKSERGRVAREVTVDPTTRRYRGAIDLDDPELAAIPPAELATWLWIDPSLPVGAPVRILATDCSLTERDDDVPGLAVRGHHVRCEGSGQRTDDYGDMRYSWTEDWWYDPTTGLVLAQAYEEQDGGTVEGLAGRFVRRSELALTAASHVAVSARPTRQPARAPAPAPRSDERASPLAGCVGLAAVGSWALGLWVVVLGAIGLVWVVARGRRVPDVLDGTTFGRVRIAPLTDALALAGRDTSACSQHFGPFLEDFADRARAGGDPVWTATGPDGAIVGLAWYERDAAIGTVLCRDPAVAANLVRRLDKDQAVEFFTERRVEVGGRPRYNLHERWVVLACATDREHAVDTSAVRRYQPADRADVLALLKAEWGGADATPFGPWLDRQVDRGDPAFVALVDGKVVGFALAGVVGANGRLSLAVVAPSHRDRGLGSELVRARLTALHRLGVERAIVEVADWNVAPLHVLRKLGFEDVGELFVESSSSTRRRRAVVRR